MSDFNDQTTLKHTVSPVKAKATLQTKRSLCFSEEISKNIEFVT